MNEGRFRGDGRFHLLLSKFLDFTSTCREQPFSHTKSKVSEYEQLILVSTPGKSLRRFRKQSFGKIGWF